MGHIYKTNAPHYGPHPYSEAPFWLNQVSEYQDKFGLNCWAPITSSGAVDQLRT